MITRDGAKMSKSKGNTVSPGRVRRALRRRHRAHLHLLHGAARARRRLVRRGRRGRLPLPRAALAPRRARSPSAPRPGEPTRRRARARPASCSPRPTGRSTRSTRDIERALPVQHGDRRGDGARQRRLPAQGRPLRRPGRARAAVRFATATAASLIFPFAPHLGAEVYERLAGERVWEQPWPEADPALLDARHRSRWSSRSTASCATGSRSAADASEERAARARPGEREGRSATSTARRSSRRSSCPGKLVNLVVR